MIERLAADLTAKCGRGFGKRNLFQMRSFYLAYPAIVQTPSAQSPGDGGGSEKVQFASAQSASLSPASPRFPLPWSHYARLLAVASPAARQFYEQEALRGGWSIRQLDRQIGSQFYERTALSKNKQALLRKGQQTAPTDLMSPEEEIKDPYLLEFLDLKDEYSETQLEAALIANLEQFLLELGGDFTFVGRQRRLRIGDEWYRIDLLFFHRRLRCLVSIDLKLGKFTHADAGQMHLYLNYAREHWTIAGENPPGNRKERRGVKWSRQDRVDEPREGPTAEAVASEAAMVSHLISIPLPSLHTYSPRKSEMSSRPLPPLLSDLPTVRLGRC